MDILRRRKKLIAPILLALLVVLPFWDLIRLPADQVVSGNDLNFMFLHWWRFALDSLRQGELPLWNPHLFAGTPFLANPQPALLYPPTWLILALPLARAAVWLFLLHFWLAGLGMYAWLRSENADGAGAFVGALILTFNGCFAVRTLGGHLGVVMTLAWLPAVLWAYHRAIQRQSPARAVLAGAPLALSFLAGHTASFLYVGLAFGLYALHLAWRGWQRTGHWRDAARPLLLAGLMSLVGIGLAAIQLLPTWELVGLSGRQGASYAFASEYAWPPGYLITLLVPNFFGEMARTGYWGDGIYTELVFYAGVLPLLLALVLGFRLKHRCVPLLWSLAGLGLLLALGPFTIVHRLAYHFVPLFGSARAPARAGFLFVFAVAALAGLTVTWLRQRPDETQADLRRRMRGPLLWTVLALSLLVILTGFLLFALQRESNPEVGRLWHVANHTALFLFFFLLATGLLHAWGTGRLTTRSATLLAAGLVLLDLWSFGRSIIQPAPVTESAYWREVAALVDEDAGRVLPWGLGIFEQNQGMALGMRSVFGYDPLELAGYDRLITSLPDPRARAYDLLNARYLVTGHEIDFPDAPESPRLIGQQGGVWVYERPRALPPAWLVHQFEVHPGDAILARINDSAFDPHSAVLLEHAPACELAEPDGFERVRLTRRYNNRIEVEVESASGGVLVLSEVFYPGWRAEVDGEAAPVLRANYALRAVCVPPGAHRVSLFFVPRSLQWGAGISALCLLLVGWAGVSVKGTWVHL